MNDLTRRHVSWTKLIEAEWFRVYACSNTRYIFYYHILTCNSCEYRRERYLLFTLLHQTSLYPLGLLRRQLENYTTRSYHRVIPYKYRKLEFSKSVSSTWIHKENNGNKDLGYNIMLMSYNFHGASHQGIKGWRWFIRKTALLRNCLFYFSIVSHCFFKYIQTYTCKEKFIHYYFCVGLSWIISEFIYLLVNWFISFFSVLLCVRVCMCVCIFFFNTEQE